MTRPMVVEDTPLADRRRPIRAKSAPLAALSRANPARTEPIALTTMPRAVSMRESPSAVMPGRARACSAAHGHAAVHAQDLAGDVAGVVGGKEGHGGRDVLGLAILAHGNDAEGGLEAGLIDLAQHLRGDVAGRDGVDGDTVARHLGRDRPEHGGDAAFRSGADRVAVAAEVGD